MHERPTKGRLVLKGEFNALHANYMYQRNEDALFMKIQQAISRTTSPNIGLFVLILMHFSCHYELSVHKPINPHRQVSLPQLTSHSPLYWRLWVLPINHHSSRNKRATELRLSQTFLYAFLIHHPKFLRNSSFLAMRSSPTIKQVSSFKAKRSCVMFTRILSVDMLAFNRSSWTNQAS